MRHLLLFQNPFIIIFINQLFYLHSKILSYTIFSVPILTSIGFLCFMFVFYFYYRFWLWKISSFAKTSPWLSLTIINFHLMILAHLNIHPFLNFNHKNFTSNSFSLVLKSITTFFFPWAAPFYAKNTRLLSVIKSSIQILYLSLFLSKGEKLKQIYFFNKIVNFSLGLL